jgi:hypothetical protein
MALTSFGKFLKGKANEKKAKKKDKTVSPDDEDDVLAQTFKKFDKDNSGALDEAEMLKAMQDIVGGKVNPAMVSKVMNEIDTNKNGTIELEEFYDFFEKVDDLIKTGFGREAANGGTEATNGSTGSKQGAAATSQGVSGSSQEANDELLKKVTGMHEAQNEGMAKMQAELKAVIQALQEQQNKGMEKMQAEMKALQEAQSKSFEQMQGEMKTLQEKHQSQTDLLKKEVQELKGELVEVKSYVTELKAKESKKKDKKRSSDSAPAQGETQEGGEELS